MTDKEALKLALEALEGFYEYGYDRQECFEHITAIKEALAGHAMRETQRLGQEIEQEPVACKTLCELCVKRGYAFCAIAVKTTPIPFPPQPERHELQAKGKHPAPCARHCEANAFQIVIKNLKAQLAQPEQEPVAYLCENAVGHRYFRWKKPSSTYKPIALYTSPPQHTWVGLTEQDLDYLCNLAYTGDEEFALAVQAKLMEKNA